MVGSSRSSFIIAPLVITTALLAEHPNLNREPAGITLDVAAPDVFAWGQVIGFGGAWALAIACRRRTCGSWSRRCRSGVWIAFVKGFAEMSL